MIRKQLYITSQQERALKLRAREEGISEAEVVRSALDRHLTSQGSNGPKNIRERALQELLEGNDRLARLLRPDARRFRREELYEERESRWVKPSRE